MGNSAINSNGTNAGNVTFPSTGTLATIAGVESLTNKSLVGPTLTTPLEKVYSTSGNAVTIDLSLGSVWIITTTGNLTITLPTVTSSNICTFTILIKYTGAHTVTFVGGSNIKYPSNGVAPIPTKVNGRTDIYVCTQISFGIGGQATLIADGGRDF